MKKLLFVMSIILLVLLVIFGSLYVIDHKRMESNEPVVFSTWGNKYAPPLTTLEIPPELAIKKAKDSLSKKSIETITNFDNPKIEEVVFDTQPSIYYFEDKINIAGKPLYKITFNTTMDALLGPMIFYVDRSNGNLIGTEYRE